MGAFLQRGMRMSPNEPDDERPCQRTDRTAPEMKNRSPGQDMLAMVYYRTRRLSGVARKPAKPEEKVAPPKDAPVEPEKGVGGEDAGGKGETPASTASAAMPHPPGALSSWAEKYRPKSLDEVVGNSRAVGELRKWAGDWEHGHARKKGAILVGSPGTGKTSAAHALAADMKWGVLELNASDSRNYAAIKRVAFSGAVHDTFSDDGSSSRPRPAEGSSSSSTRRTSSTNPPTGRRTEGTSATAAGSGPSSRPCRGRASRSC